MKPFWKEKALSELNHDEWESLCDRCGLCCRLKEEDEDTGEVVDTIYVCRMIDLETCQCRDYKNRQNRVPDCIVLTPEKAMEFNWLPRSCAYRLLVQGFDLPAWHPLISGDPESAHKAGFSIREHILAEDDS